MAAVQVRVELDADTDRLMNEWSHRERRSKREHLAVMARKLARLEREQPEKLAELGLLDRLLTAAN